jgi:hypothetical protein
MAMNIPAIGSTIKLNFDLEVEDEYGYIDVIHSGKDVTVVGYDLPPDETIESHLNVYGTLPLIVEVGDVERYSQTDRSGQSDYTLNGGVHPIEIELSDIA